MPPVGVFPMVAVMVSGQSQALVPLPMPAQTKVCYSVSVLRQPRGILLRVLLATTIAFYSMSSTTQAIGLHHLLTTTRTTLVSTTLATLVRQIEAFALAVYLSVVSENQNNLNYPEFIP